MKQEGVKMKQEGVKMKQEGVKMKQEEVKMRQGELKQSKIWGKPEKSWLSNMNYTLIIMVVAIVAGAFATKKLYSSYRVENIKDGTYSAKELQKYYLPNGVSVTLENDNDNTIESITTSLVEARVTEGDKGYTLVNIISRQLAYTEEELGNFEYEVRNNGNRAITIKYNIGHTNISNVRLTEQVSNQYGGKPVVTECLSGEALKKGNIYYIIKEEAKFSTEVKDTTISYDLYEVRDRATSELVYYMAIESAQ